MNRKNYFSWGEAIMEVLSDGRGYNKRSMAEALKLKNQTPLSTGPAAKALADLVKSGKVMQEGGGYRIVKTDALLAPLSLKDVDIDLQTTLDAFVKSVIRVVSERYEQDRFRQAKALSEAETRISELSSELATFKFNSRLLPKVSKIIQNYQ